MRFETIELGEVCELGDGAHAKVKRVDKGIPYLTSKNIKKGHLELTKVDYISEEDYKKLFSPSSNAVRDLKYGDVLVGIIGTFGNVYLYGKNDCFGISSSIGIIRPNLDKIIPEYLYFQVKSERFTNTVEMFKGGSVQGYTNLPTLKKMPIYITTIENQIKIVNILSSFEKKINLNQKLIRNLEELSQSLFKRWFIDFEFPNEKGLPYKSSGGEMVESELGKIPESWEVISIDDVTQVVSKGTTPRKKDLEVCEEETYALFLKVRDISDTGEINFSSLDKIPLSIHENQLKRSKLLEKDLLVSIAGTIGRISYVPKNVEEINANQAVAFLRLKSMDLFSYIYMLIKSEDFAEYLSKKIVQAVQANVSLTTLKEYKLVLPNTDVLTNWKSVADDFIKQVEVLRVENSRLIELRDSLLPKLLSGEIELPDESVVN